MAELHSTDVQDYLSDVGCYLTTCTAAFMQIGAVLRQAAQLTDKYSDLHKLISVAEYLATDIGNSADCWREEVKSKEYKPAEAASMDRI